MTFRQDNPRIDAILNDLFEACKTDRSLLHVVSSIRTELRERKQKRYEARLLKVRKNITDADLKALKEAVQAHDEGLRGVRTVVSVESQDILHQAGLVNLGGHPTRLGIHLTWLLNR